MSCKDKKKDMKMREQLSQREAIKHDYDIIEITYFGDITEIVHQVQDNDDILHITRMNKGEYIASVRINNV